MKNRKCAGGYQRRHGHQQLVGIIPIFISADVPAYNVTQMDELFSEPLSSLSATELELLADYCMWRSNKGHDASASSRWVTRATFYQNQLNIQANQ